MRRFISTQSKFSSISMSCPWRSGIVIGDLRWALTHDRRVLGPPSPDLAERSALRTSAEVLPLLSGRHVPDLGVDLRLDTALELQAVEVLGLLLVLALVSVHQAAPPQGSL